MVPNGPTPCHAHEEARNHDHFNKDLTSTQEFKEWKAYEVGRTKAHLIQEQRWSKLEAGCDC